ncbi:hypothetical protein ES703_22827 [subsurface metagenome]
MNTSIPSLLITSISKAAANATISPGTLQPWVEEIEQTVAEKGKFSKPTVAYIPLSPPPVFFDYKCKKCRFWIAPDACGVVEGKISPIGWCAIWLPPDDKPAFSWINELLRGDW